MAKSAKNPGDQAILSHSAQGAAGVRLIELARDEYQRSVGTLPVTVEQLVSYGYLKNIPADPYGGIFYFEADGKVAQRANSPLENWGADVGKSRSEQ